ncbi:hypothetical protein [Pectobacterium versatile]|uniref:hypothetical protein n=1 Tax=Pectobacterium versatile TaxID=2488639 RepID=UPI001F016EC7|nr:hypothetical protein [Pectobacterium versatile]
MSLTDTKVKKAKSLEKEYKLTECEIASHPLASSDIQLNRGIVITIQGKIGIPRTA